MRENMQGNRLMLLFSGLSVLMAIGIYLLHHVFGFLVDYVTILENGQGKGNDDFLRFWIMIAPILLLGAAGILFFKNKEHSKLPLLLTLVFTFSSIAMIAAGNGLIEYHFSIFIMLALISYFNQVSLILISAGIFAVYHFGGYFFFPELLCGTSEYRFSLLMIHAVFLILSTVANLILVFYKQRFEQDVSRERQEVSSQFHTIVEQLQQTAANILYVSEHIKSGSENAGGISTNIASATQTLNEGAQMQLEQARDNLGQLSGMITILKELESGTAAAAENVESAAGNALEGQTFISSTKQQFFIIQEVVGKLELLITEFQTSVKDIKSFARVISSISDQTNMLALNASIEAARAGESGKGFAVVAEEVRKLAFQSETAAGNIRKRVQDIDRKAASIFTEVEAGAKEVERGAAYMSASNDIFETILTSTSLIQTEINQMVSVSKHISEHSSAVQKSIKNMIGISEEGLQNSAEISTAAQQQLASADEMNDVSGQLREHSRRLEDLVEKVGPFLTKK